MNSIKLFPVVTDLHLRFTKPRCRTDENYLDSQLKDLQYLITQHTYKTNLVLCAGDVFNIYNDRPEVFLKLVSLLKKLNKVLVTTLGQHDVPNHDIKNWEKNSYFGLNNERIIVLTSGNILTIPIENDLKIILSGYGYGEQETENLLESNIRLNPASIDSIHTIDLIHASVGHYDTVVHKSIARLAYNPKGLGIFGDIHSGFEVHKHRAGGKSINPGAMARQSTIDKDRKLYVCEVVLNDTNLEFNIEEAISLNDTTNLFFNTQVPEVLFNRTVSLDIEEIKKQSQANADISPFDKIDLVAANLNITNINSINYLKKKVENYGK